MDVFLMLVFAHILLDFPLQGDFMSKAKNRFNPIPGVPAAMILTMHAALHGIAVYAITGIPWFGLSEFYAHAMIDDLKCENRIGFKADQIAHLAMKALFAAALSYLPIS
jgi:hypothetical protein